MDFMYFSFSGTVRAKLVDNRYREVNVHTGVMACYGFWDAIKRVKLIAREKLEERGLDGDDIVYIWVDENKFKREPQFVR